MNDIISWIKAENLWFVMGYRIVHSEFDAEIWCHYNVGHKLLTKGWWGKGSMLEDALRMAYEKCKVGLPKVQGRIRLPSAFTEKPRYNEIVKSINGKS